MANGFSISALAGKRSIMRLGGMDHDQPRVFLLSTTNGAETHALAAAIETMRIYTAEPVVEHLYGQGERLRQGIHEKSRCLGLEDYFQVVGRPCNLVYATKNEKHERCQAYRALFLQEIIRRGVIAPSFVVSYSHSDPDIQRTIDVVGEALAVYRKALDEGIEKYLYGRPVKPVNRRFN
jgi:glutamate-1-semialdehyde 2,1-aminomutase